MLDWLANIENAELKRKIVWPIAPRKPKMSQRPESRFPAFATVAGGVPSVAIGRSPGAD